MIMYALSNCQDVDLGQLTQPIARTNCQGKHNSISKGNFTP